MPPIWKGSISFGLVNIPVRLFPATKEETLDFHMLDDRDHARIRYKRVSEATGKEVPFEHIVKGFEQENGEYVVLSDEEIQNASPEKSTTIDILEFVDEAQIPSLYFDRPYYLEPEKSAAKAYALFCDALAHSGKVGIAQFVLRNREHLCALKAQDSVLVLNTLRFADEIRPTAGPVIPHGKKTGKKEFSMAARLILRRIFPMRGPPDSVLDW
jgi:DNA end-binding protein Ku